MNKEEDMFSQGFLTVSQLQKKLSVSRSYAYKLVNQGLFPVIRIADDTIRIPVKPLNDYLLKMVC